MPTKLRFARVMAGPRLVLALVAGLLCATTARTTAAQDPPPSADDLTAQRIFGAGNAAFRAGRFDDALEYFEEAYRLSQRPELLYNVGLAAESAGQRERAVSSYEECLRVAPADASYRTLVETRLAVLRRSGRGDRRAPEPAAADTGGGGGAAPWIVFGIGTALAIGGGVVLGVGINDAVSVDDSPEGTEWRDVSETAERAPILEGIGAAALGIGVIAATIGLVWGAGSSEETGVTEVAVGAGHVTILGKF